jgi:predicted RNase H-like HicB family nuclease
MAGMAKVVYTVVFDVTSGGVKVTAPALPGFYFTAETPPEAEFEWKNYVEVFLKLLRKAHKPLPTKEKSFRIQTLFIEVNTCSDKNADKVEPNPAS